MKEPVTREGRVLKCPMCRVPEKVPGKRTSFSYEYELSKMYEAVPVRVPVRAPVPAPRRDPQEEWASVAESIRILPLVTQQRYIHMYPQLAPYFEIYHPAPVIDPRQPHRLAVEAAIAHAERLPFAAQVAPENRAAMRPPRPVDYHAFCQSGNREAGTCPTRGKTERKCTHPGCTKYVCRACRQCITH